jgi:hypothetical protein
MIMETKTMSETSATISMHRMIDEDDLRRIWK